MDTSAVLELTLTITTYILSLVAALILIYYAISSMNPGFTTGQATAFYVSVQLCAIVLMLVAFGNDSAQFWINSALVLNNGALMAQYGKRGKTGMVATYAFFVLVHALLAISWIPKYG